MALITCTECGKRFSDKAAACPECGCPTEEIIKAIKCGNTAPRKAEPQSDAGITVTISKKPLISAEDAAKKMKKVCAHAITEAESASNSFDFANKMIQTKAGGTMDLFGSDTLSRVAYIAADVKKACDELYSVLQVQVITVDSACRPLMESDPGVEAICDAACTIAYLNEESRISNNFTGSLNGSASSGLASARYSPSIDSVAIEKFWAASLNEMPGGKEARNAWHANRRKAEQEKRDANAPQVPGSCG